MATDNTTPHSDISHEIKEANKYLSRFTNPLHVFLRGILGGVGWSVGATIIITMLLWLMAQLEYIPFIGDISAYIRETIEQGSPVQSPTNTD